MCFYGEILERFWFSALEFQFFSPGVFMKMSKRQAWIKINFPLHWIRAYLEISNPNIHHGLKSRILDKRCFAIA